MIIMKKICLIVALVIKRDKSILERVRISVNLLNNQDTLSTKKPIKQITKMPYNLMSYKTIKIISNH